MPDGNGHIPTPPADRPRPSDGDEQLTQQVLQYLNGELSADEVSQLGSRLRADVSARELFVRICLLESWLTEKFAPGRREFLAQMMLEESEEHGVATSFDAGAMPVVAAGRGFVDDDDESELLVVPTWPKPPVPATPWWRRKMVWAAAASVALGVGVWLTVQNLVTPSGPVPVVATQSDAQDETLSDVQVATLSGAQDAVWVNRAKAPAIGDPLHATVELEIQSGLARVTFKNGAKVVVEGPARFTPETDGRLSLASGRITALVSPEAKGFTVNTPTAEVVDLGTEFGVDVPPVSGAAVEVQVFDGLVTLAPAANASAPPQLVRAGAGARVDLTGVVTPVPANPAPFVRNAEAEAIERAKKGSSFDRWVAHRFAIVRDNDVVAYYPFEAENKEKSPDRLTNVSVAGAEFDGTLTGKDSAKPKWVEGRFPQKQALHFGGAGGISRVELPTGASGVDFGRGGESFTVAAWVKFDVGAGQDAARAGDPPRDNTATFLAGNGHFGVLTRIVEKYERLSLSAEINGNIGVGLGLDAPVTAIGKRFAVVNSGQRATASWQHVVVTYDQVAGRVAMFVNGQSAGEREAKADPNKAVGRVGFGCRVNLDGEYHDSMEGAVDELVIVRRAMKADEIRSMYEAGKPD